jgi:hypothetical protein
MAVSDEEMDRRVRVLAERKRHPDRLICPDCAGWVKWNRGRGWKCGVCLRRWDLVSLRAVWE